MHAVVPLVYAMDEVLIFFNLVVIDARCVDEFWS